MASFGVVMLLALAASQTPPEVGFCELNRTPDRYVGQLIHMRARLVDTSPHGWYFVDDACDASMVFGGYDRAPDMQEAMTMLMPWVIRSGPLRPLRVSVTGRITRGKNEMGEPKLYFAVTDVDAMSFGKPRKGFTK